MPHSFTESDKKNKKDPKKQLHKTFKIVDQAFVSINAEYDLVNKENCHEIPRKAINAFYLATTVRMSTALSLAEYYSHTNKVETTKSYIKKAVESGKTLKDLFNEPQYYAVTKLKTIELGFVFYDDSPDHIFEYELKNLNPLFSEVQAIITQLYKFNNTDIDANKNLSFLYYDNLHKYYQKNGHKDEASLAEQTKNIILETYQPSESSSELLPKTSLSLDEQTQLNHMFSDLSGELPEAN